MCQLFASATTHNNLLMNDLGLLQIITKELDIMTTKGTHRFR